MKVAVKGVGLTKFGELWEKTLEDLILESAQTALADAKMEINDIEAIFIGNMLSSKLSSQDHLGAVCTTLLGTNVPAFKLEAACASGGVALHNAVNALNAGTYKNVLVIGAEKMTDASIFEVTSALMGAGSEEERMAGLTFPALYALIARAHMHKYNTTREQMAAVAVKNHYHASLNKKAQFPFEITADKVLNSPYISSPFTLFDASPITDGAAAVVLSAQADTPGVYITASAVATDTVGVSQRQELTELRATKMAAQKAYSQAGLTADSVDVAEVHDCFTIAEILAMEDLGFCPKGQGGAFIEKGTSRLGGKLPINTSGGLKACGHPVGATGIKQIVELTEQLQGKSDKRQVKDAKIGLAQNVGGTGATVAVHILQNYD